MRWPWERGKDVKQGLTEETERLQRRLEGIERDDKPVHELGRRAARLMRDNHLVEELRRALGVHE